MKKIKIQKTFVDHGLGFPVRLLHVPMVNVRGVWTPNINYNRLTQTVLEALCEKSSRLTGNEVRFIRLHFEMTLKEFAKRFAVSHVAVLKWESMKNHTTSMSWSIEKDLRLFLRSKTSSKSTELVSLYQKLEHKQDNKNKLLQLNMDEAA